MQKFTADEQLVAKDAKGNLIAASTKDDGSIVIVVEDGRKLTYTAEQVEAIRANATAKAKAEAKPKAKAEAKPEKDEKKSLQDRGT